MHFSAQAQRIKKIHPEKKSLYFRYFRKRNFLALILNNFRKWKHRKKLLLFQETENLKKLLIFPEMKLFSPLRQNLFYFRKQKPPKKSLYFPPKKLLLYFGKRKP